VSLRGAWVSLLRPEEDPGVETVAAEIRQELEAHLEMRTEDNVTQGMDPLEARRDAERRFGDVDRIERACRAHSIGGRIMLQRINLALTGILGITVIWMFVQNHHLRVQTVLAQDRMMAFSEAINLERERATQVETIEIAVGDEIEVHDMAGHWVPFTVRVARDGKLLLPEVGWVDVAGLQRQAAEERVTKVLSQYFQGVDVKLVVLDAE